MQNLVEKDFKYYVTLDDYSLSVVGCDMCRTRMVVGVGSRHISGSFLEVIEKQGWQGLWAGNAVNMIRIIPTQAIEFATFECVKRAMTSTQEKWKQAESHKVQIGPVSLNLSISWISPVAVAGAAAGVVSTLVCHPLEVLKVFISWVNFMRIEI